MFRVVSIVEAFLANELVARAEPHAPPPRTRILDDMYTRAEDGAIASWPRMLDHYKRWFDIRISRSTCPSWQRVEAMNNVRNAIAHGVGALTRRMARRNLTQLRRDFGTIDVVVIDDYVHISDSALRAATLAGREFIEWVDAALTAYDRSISDA